MIFIWCALSHWITTFVCFFCFHFFLFHIFFPRCFFLLFLSFVMLLLFIQFNVYYACNGTTLSQSVFSALFYSEYCSSILRVVQEYAKTVLKKKNNYCHYAVNLCLNSGKNMLFKGWLVLYHHLLIGICTAQLRYRCRWLSVRK